MALTSSGLNLAQSTERSWEPLEPQCGSSDEETSRTGPPMDSQAQESQWPSTSLSTEESRSVLLTPHPYPSDLSSTPTERFGILPQDEGYSTFDPVPLTNKALWSTPSACLVWQETPWRSEPPCRFPRGYAAGYDIPMPLPDSPLRWWHGAYKGKGKSCLIAAADGDEDMAGEAGEQPGGLLGQPTPPTKKDSNRLAPCLNTNDRGPITWNRRSKP